MINVILKQLDEVPVTDIYRSQLLYTVCPKKADAE